MKKIISLIIVLVILIGCSNTAKSSSDDSLTKVLEKETFIVGHTHYPPFGFIDDGESVGFDIDMAKEVAKRLNVGVEFKYIDWDSKQFELDNNNIDAIWNGFTITSKREKEVTFSKPYFDNHIVMMSLVGSEYKSLEDLKDKLVGVELQSSGQLALEAKTEINDLIKEIRKFTSVSEALMALKTGGIDVIVVDENFARYISSKERNLFEISEARFNPENYGVGFRKGSFALASKIDEIIDEMILDKTAAKISIKWFGEDLISR